MTQAHGDAAQLRDTTLPLGRMHEHPQADDGVEAAVGELERVRVTTLKRDRQQLLGGTLTGDGEHFLRRVDRRHLRAARRENQRSAPGAGADIEHPPILDPSDHVREHTGLRLGDQLSDRAAESALVERLRHGGIGVRGVAVVVGVGGSIRFHATSFTTSPAGGAGNSASHACLVLSRYAA